MMMALIRLYFLKLLLLLLPPSSPLLELPLRRFRHRRKMHRDRHPWWRDFFKGEAANDILETATVLVMHHHEKYNRVGGERRV